MAGFGKWMGVAILAALWVGCDGGGDGGPDAGPDTGADAATDTGPGADAGADAGECGMTCGEGTLCCPVALHHECVAPTSAGECPLPDLSISAERASDSARVEWLYFEADDCTIVEGCIAEPGWRRLLRFDTFTPNLGTGDLHLGVPDTSTDGVFVYSECHDHYHFEGYANYQLLDGAGEPAAFGHKQAFCLLDSERVDETDTTVARRERYDCDNQGIQRGWGDNYDASLDCQWVDVTDVTPGTYTLRISINEGRAIPELSYDNNVVDVSVEIPVDAPLDPTRECPVIADGIRECGWDVGASGDCTPGAEYEAVCGNECGDSVPADTCDGDPIMRVCPGDEPCEWRGGLAQNDDGCDVSVCPKATFVCPESGRYTLLTAAFANGEAYTCTPVVSATGG